jgi:hypothetical protein
MAVLIDSIVNLTTNHPITFTIGDNALRVSKIPVASANLDKIVGLVSLNSLSGTYTYHSSIADNFVVQKMTTGLGCLSLFQENTYI